MRDFILNLQNPEALEVAQQLDLDVNILGYDTSTQFSSRAGGLGHFALNEKLKHPNCLILFQKGLFAECMGIDALVFIECCNLKPMGGRSETGIPLSSIQCYLNKVTRQGFSVAVYEEVASDGKGNKVRKLIQIVSPSQPMYFSSYTLHQDVFNVPDAKPLCVICGGGFSAAETGGGFSAAEALVLELFQVVGFPQQKHWYWNCSRW